MNSTVVYIGVDVSKAYLDVAWAERSGRFANGKSGWGALIKWIKQGALPLICEASGGYERGLLDAAEQNGIKLSLVQANRVRQYARAGWHFGKDRQGRCPCALRLWQRHATRAHPAAVGSTKAVTRIGNAAPTPKPNARFGAKSAGTVKR